jgi:hypothetical protein
LGDAIELYRLRDKGKLTRDNRKVDMNRQPEAKTLSGLNGTWRTSTRSQGDGACVEVRLNGLGVEVRDSKDRSGPILGFTSSQWTTFIDAVAGDELAAPQH